MMGPDDASDDGFLEDDDGAGYAEQQLNGYGKRPGGHFDDDDLDGAVPRRKRQAVGLQPRLHESFQPGSTPGAATDDTSA